MNKYYLVGFRIAQGGRNINWFKEFNPNNSKLLTYLYDDGLCKIYSTNKNFYYDRQKDKIRFKTDACNEYLYVGYDKWLIYAGTMPCCDGVSIEKIKKSLSERAGGVDLIEICRARSENFDEQLKASGVVA